jgi:hypothetical protein
MAQPTKISATAVLNTYCVIDNGPANAGVDQQSAPAGYDNATGAASQLANLSQTNGSLPDFLVAGNKGGTLTTVTASVVALRGVNVIFKNPA